MVWKNISRMIWFITASQTLSLAFVDSHRPSMPIIGNTTLSFPTKLATPDPLETSPNRSLTAPGLTPGPAMVLHTCRTTTTLALPRAMAALLD